MRVSQVYHRFPAWNTSSATPPNTPAPSHLKGMFVCFFFISLFVGVLGQAGPWDAPLSLHPDSTRDLFNAKCLDGSNGGFYFRAATNPESKTKWKFHFMGGGWCNTAGDCAGRANSLLGSSKFWTPWLSDLWSGTAGFYGLMSLNSSDVNPFGDWNMVWLAYCDGTSQTSDRVDPVSYKGRNLYFRGRAILDAHFYELERLYAFQSTATEVIVSGTSAGGASAFFQSSYIKTLLKAPGAIIVNVPDAGWWYDALAFNSNTSHPWVDSLEPSLGPDLWNATLRGALMKCLADPPNNKTVYCFTQPYAYAYLDVPTFVIQSMVDPANLGYCHRMPCNLNGNSNGNCNAGEVQAIQAYATDISQSIAAAQKQFSDRDGRFLTSCSQHEESCRFHDWFNISVGGKTMNTTFSLWYNSRGSCGDECVVVDSPWPGDGSCGSCFLSRYQ